MNITLYTPKPQINTIELGFMGEISDNVYV